MSFGPISMRNGTPFNSQCDRLKPGVCRSDVSPTMNRLGFFEKQTTNNKLWARKPAAFNSATTVLHCSTIEITYNSRFNISQKNKTHGILKNSVISILRLYVLLNNFNQPKTYYLEVDRNNDRLNRRNFRRQNLNIFFKKKSKLFEHIFVFTNPISSPWTMTTMPKELGRDRENEENTKLSLSYEYNNRSKSMFDVRNRWKCNMIPSGETPRILERNVLLAIRTFERDLQKKVLINIILIYNGAVYVENFAKVLTETVRRCCLDALASIPFVSQFLRY